MSTMMVTTGAQAIYNVQVVNPGFPSYSDLSWGLIATRVPARTTETISTPNFGAWYINAHTVLDLPAQYQTADGKTHTARVIGNYVIEPN